ADLGMEHEDAVTKAAAVGLLFHRCGCAREHVRLSHGARQQLAGFPSRDETRARPARRISRSSRPAARATIRRCVRRPAATVCSAGGYAVIAGGGGGGGVWGCKGKSLYVV